MEGHVGPLAGSVEGVEAQGGDRHVEMVQVGGSQLLAGELGDGVVGLRVGGGGFGGGEGRVAAVDR